MLKWLHSLASRIASAAPGQKVTSISSVFDGILEGRPLSKLSDYESYLKAGTRNIWATWRACDVVGKVLLDIPLETVRRGGDGTAVVNKELAAILTQPNPRLSMAQMLYLYAFHVKLTGNAFWFKDEVNYNGDRPRSVWPLNPRRMKVVVKERQGVTGYLYRINGLDIPYEVNEIIHFKNPHPDNDYYGLGDIEAGEDLFNDFLNRESYAKQFWKNGASPSGLLVCKDQITDEVQWEQAKKKWQKEYGGTGNAGKTAWLTGEWSYEKLGLTAVEMQSIENARFSVENIFHMHGVPLSVAGFKEAANFATARVDDLIFRRYTVKPLMTLWLAGVQEGLVKGFDANLQIKANVSGLTDVEAVVLNWAPLFDRGVISLNELRVMAGLAPKQDDPLFEQHFINAGLVPLELAGVPAAGGPADAQSRAIVDRFIQGTLARPGNGNGEREALHDHQR